MLTITLNSLRRTPQRMERMRLAAREETIEDSPLEDTPVQKRKVKKIKKIKKTSRKNIKLSDFENASQTTK
jgi:hypothetical protein